MLGNGVLRGCGGRGCWEGVLIGCVEGGGGVVRGFVMRACGREGSFFWERDCIERKHIAVTHPFRCNTD